MNFLYQHTDSRSKNSHEEISFFMRKPIPFEYAGWPWYLFNLYMFRWSYWCWDLSKNHNTSSRPRTSSTLWLPMVLIPWLRLPSIWGPDLQLKEMETPVSYFSLLFFLGGGGVEFGMLDSVCFSLSWRNLMVLGSFCWLLPTKIHAQQVWWKCAKHEKLTEVIQYGSSNLGESCFYIQDLCVYIVSSL